MRRLMLPHGCASMPARVLAHIVAGTSAGSLLVCALDGYAAANGCCEGLRRMTAANSWLTFSRHAAQVANPLATTKMINVGDSHWVQNRLYEQPGGSDRVTEEIQQMVARLREEEARAEAEAEAEAEFAAEVCAFARVVRCVLLCAGACPPNLPGRRRKGWGV